MTTDIVVPATGEVVAVPARLAVIPEMDPLQMAFDVAFDAKNLEDAMIVKDTEEVAEGISTLEGHVVTIYAAWRIPSPNENNRSGWYLLLDLEDNLGVRRPRSTGSPQPMAIIARAVAEDKLPLVARVVLGKKGKHPNAPVFLINQDRSDKQDESEPFG